MGGYASSGCGGAARDLVCNLRDKMIRFHAKLHNRNARLRWLRRWLVFQSCASLVANSLVQRPDEHRRRLRSSTVGGYEPVPTNASNTKRRRGSRGVRVRFNDTHGEEEASSSLGAYAVGGGSLPVVPEGLPTGTLLLAPAHPQAPPRPPTPTANAQRPTPMPRCDEVCDEVLLLLRPG